MTDSKVNGFENLLCKDAGQYTNLNNTWIKRNLNIVFLQSAYCFNYIDIFSVFIFLMYDIFHAIVKEEDEVLYNSKPEDWDFTVNYNGGNPVTSCKAETLKR